MASRAPGPSHSAQSVQPRRYVVRVHGGHHNTSHKDCWPTRPTTRFLETLQVVTPAGTGLRASFVRMTLSEW